MNVAVPLPKHSPMFGQDASSHTVCKPCARNTCLTALKRWPSPSRTLIHAGFFRRSAGTTLIGMRAVFASPFCLVRNSSMSSIPRGIVQPLGWKPDFVQRDRDTRIGIEHEPQWQRP